MTSSELNDAKLCEVIKDPKQNSHCNTWDQIVELWGWDPGEGRPPIPMSQAEFAAKIKEWVAKGEACPASSTTSLRLSPITRAEKLLEGWRCRDANGEH